MVKNARTTGEVIFEKGSVITLANNMSINGAAVRFNEGSRLESGPSGSLLVGEYEKTSPSALTVDGGHLLVGGSSITVGKAMAGSHGVATLTLISGSIQAASEKPTAGELRISVPGLGRRVGEPVWRDVDGGAVVSSTGGHGGDVEL